MKRHLGIEWDNLQNGSGFTVRFRNQPPTGYHMTGQWTIVKIPPSFMVNFDKGAEMFEIPMAKDSVIEAMALSTGSPHAYHLTRGSVREILEWAQNQAEGVVPEDVISANEIPLIGK